MSLRARRDGRQGILPYVLKAAQRDDVTARAGLPLVVETMRALGLDEVAREQLPKPERERGFPPEQKLEALVTLIAAGGDRVEDVRILGEDKGLEALLQGPFPSPDALLDFLSSFHDPKCWDDRPPEKKAFVPPESSALRAPAPSGPAAWSLLPATRNLSLKPEATSRPAALGCGRQPRQALLPGACCLRPETCL